MNKDLDLALRLALSIGGAIFMVMAMGGAFIVARDILRIASAFVAN